MLFNKKWVLELQAIGGVIGGGNGLDPNADVVPRDLQNSTYSNSCKQ